jgi:sugar/nucleoside kinase (ribokinase family)
MHDVTPALSIDYLVIGHVSKDLTPEGSALGGTAAYSGLTAHALGLRVGVVTSTGADLDLSPLAGLAIQRLPSPSSTTFENRYGGAGREQFLHARAQELGPSSVPSLWRSARIVHLGPIAGEVDTDLVDFFPAALLGLTPQGWMRSWDGQGRVFPSPLPEKERILAAAGAVVISLEDVSGDESAIEELAELTRLLVVTDAGNGARVYWNRDQRRVPAPHVPEVDPTGSGDIFAAAFFSRLYQTRDPWEAARFANILASASVTRRGIAATPTPAEVDAAGLQVIP